MPFCITCDINLMIFDFIFSMHVNFLFPLNDSVVTDWFQNICCNQHRVAIARGEGCPAGLLQPRAAAETATTFDENPVHKKEEISDNIQIKIPMPTDP